jgi:hypothetical protein
VTRTQAATDAGLSERQRKTAPRIASIPEPEFEAIIADRTAWRTAIPRPTP